MIKRPQKPPIIPVTNPAEYFDPTISMRHEKWIARIVVEWSKLEGAMDDLTWSFLGLTIEFGRLITQRMDATNKITLLRALSELCFSGDCYDSHLADYMKEYLDVADIFREDRNFIVHGTWGRNSKGVPIAMLLRVKDNPSQVVSETFPQERMEAIAQGILIAKWGLYRIQAVAAAAHDRAHNRFLAILERQSALMKR